MAFSEHRKLDIRSSDMVVDFRKPHPRQRAFQSLASLTSLLRKGADVVYEALAEVHVSGHACQEELKLMHALIKPKFFIPVHGEYRMLSMHKKLAMSMGMPEDHVIIPRDGRCDRDQPQFRQGARARCLPAQCWWTAWASVM